MKRVTIPNAIAFTALSLSAVFIYYDNPEWFHKSSDLWIQAENGQISELERRFKVGEDLNAKDYRQGEQFPLYIAAEKGNLEVVTWLVEKGATIDQEKVLGLTPLAAAAVAGHLEVAQFLVKKGADPNHRLTGGDLRIVDLVKNEKHPEMKAFLEPLTRPIEKH